MTKILLAVAAVAIAGGGGAGIASALEPQTLTLTFVQVTLTRQGPKAFTARDTLYDAKGRKAIGHDVSRCTLLNPAVAKCKATIMLGNGTITAAFKSVKPSPGGTGTVTGGTGAYAGAKGTLRFTQNAAGTRGKIVLTIR